MSGKERLRVGYAMPAKKVDTLVQPSLISHAQKAGIDLVQVDLEKPLVDQGPFHCLLHKVYHPDWNLQLSALSSKYPKTVIIDDPDAIQRIHNRQTMLDVVSLLELPIPNVTVAVPKQVFLDQQQQVSKKEKEEALLSTELRYPVVAKPLLANGTDKSHEMSLVFNADGLSRVTPPVVLQEFVNHGGVLFKVYVAGDQVKCVKRRSLPDILNLELFPEGLLPFSQISNLPPSDSNNDAAAEIMPPPEEDFVQALADALRKSLKLNLFNFDMIRDASDRNSYLVIDINYFPGYAKVPDFEPMLTAFIRSLNLN